MYPAYAVFWLDDFEVQVKKKIIIWYTVDLEFTRDISWMILGYKYETYYFDIW